MQIPSHGSALSAARAGRSMSCAACLNCPGRWKEAVFMQQANSIWQSILNNWYGRLVYVFIAVLLWQWFDCLEGFWWDETYRIVHAVLIAGAAAEFLIPGWRFLRLSVQAIAIILINLYYTGFQWVPKEIGPLREWGLWGNWLSLNLSQLEPFIWISIVVWLLFQFAGNVTKTRPQVVMIMSLFLMSLLIADSFSPIVLWDNIAWTIFIGLAWLVAEHFARFQAKHPESWSRMIEYPASLLLPTLLIIALVMASGLFVPNMSPVLKDPYTVWRESRGETVPSFVGNKGNPITSSGPTGDSRSGYSRQDEALGGGFLFDYSTVMEVTTNRKSYWRGETKAMYTGEGWIDGPRERRESSMIGLVAGEKLPLTDGPGSDIETTEVEQTVRMIREDPLPVLFGAAPMSSLASLTIDEENIAIPNRVSWLADSWELHWPDGQTSAPYPSQYTIVSHVPVLDEEVLRSSGVALDSPAKNEMYLQLPDGLPQRVKDLAQEITAVGDNPYDKAKLIETYLKENYVYTNSPDLTKKKSDDFVDAFLFEIMEGYCDYYSSAMAVLARAVDLPTRWVKGYAPGVLPFDPLSELQNFGGRGFEPDGSGTYTVRNADAHSWVELYFEGYGWIPFEPTAGFAYPYAAAEVRQDTVETDIAPPVEPVEEVKNQESSFNLSWIGAIAAVLLLVAMAIVRRREIGEAYVRWRFRTYTANQRIVLETEKLIRSGRRKGLRHAEHETMRETITRWSEDRTPLSGELQAVLLMFERAKYGAAAFTNEEAEQLALTVKSIRNRL
ncbi:DUF4129 domain-containing protein [Paenibacillaceae bacterium]|nr:DUF4129 domain-containing protein [Paenibacillaceae bacterium]